MNILYIFDFDDTLVDSDAEVKIQHADGTTTLLSSEKYAKYREQKGDVFDFSDFDSYPRNAEIIEPVFAELRSAIASSGPSNVVILTARSNPDPVKFFLNENNVGNIDIVAVGTSDPNAKAMYILERVKSDGFDEVIVFEDNVKNIRRIRKVLTKSGTKLQTNRVSNGRIVDVLRERKFRRSKK